MYSALVLAAVCIAAFVLQLAVPGFSEMFTLVSADVAARPWTLLSALFLHGDVVHLLYNLFALALFGMILEQAVGRRRFLLIFFGAGVLASIGAAVLYPAALGASGAIFGIMGALAMLRPRMQVWVGFFPMPMIMAAAVWAIGDFLGLFFPTSVANLAHLVGLAAGVGAGIYLRRGLPSLRGRKRRGVELDEVEMERWEERWMR